MCLMFFVSGFCALLYQTVWLRLAFAKFGVITPVVSVLVSVFMLGLGLGSWYTGVYTSRLKQSLKISALSFYGAAECFIGLGAFIVPWLFGVGSNFCVVTGEGNSWLYLLSSAAIMTISILPFAFAMGTTYPFALDFLREGVNKNQKTFGLLYTANTAGAWLSTVLTVFVLVEVLGFNRTLCIAAICNFAIGLTALYWGKKLHNAANQDKSVLDAQRNEVLEWPHNKVRSLIILFTTGFCFMAMEVVWIRSFTPVLGNLVYSFATLLAAYLACNWLGASLYRIHLKKQKVLSLSSLLALTAFSATLPLLVSNPSVVQFLSGGLSIEAGGGIFSSIILFSVMPFSTVLGYLTPLVIDDLSAGNPNIAGKAYAINIMGCVLGPILAGYILLPWLGARLSLALLVLPLLAILLFAVRENRNVSLIINGTVIASLAILLSSLFWFSWEEGGFLPADKGSVTVNRDYAATTISFTIDGEKALLVNGQGMTILTPVTKFMAHLPAACLEKRPKSILVICFGMGTTFRSALAWDSKVTAVELVPGVVKAFNCYYADAAKTLHNKNAHVVIDDGRRFLQRTDEKFDVIIIDSPPPLEAASSGLLYSREFFAVIKKHLNPGGILQEWFGFAGKEIYMRAMLRGLKKEFPYIRIYKATYDRRIIGYHVLASENPIPQLTAAEFYAKLPAKALSDLKEIIDFDPELELDTNQEITELFANEIPLDEMLSTKEKAIVITDDYPYNEYYLLQSVLNKQVFLGQ